MVVFLVVFLYAVFVLGGIQFFRQVHQWDEEASKMWNEELLRLESERALQSKKRRLARRGAGNLLTQT